jgi:hypothetical protein
MIDELCPPWTPSAPPSHQLEGDEDPFKKGHAAKSAQERKCTNYNIRAHPGRYIRAATAKAAVSPTKHFTPDIGHIGRNML